MKRFLTSIIIVTLCATWALADWSGTTADRNISYFSGDSQSARFPRVTVGPEGNLYIVWRQGGGFPAQYEMFFGRSTDNGATWSSETTDARISDNDGQNVSNVGDKPFGIATDSQGNIYIVWAEDLVDYQEIMLLKSTDQGAIWLHSNTDFNISFDGAPYVNANDPDIAVDSNDNLYVVWHQDTQIDSVEIHISISNDYGETWSGTSGDRYISYYNSRDATNPHIAVAPNDDIYVVWDEKSDPTNADTPRILFGKSSDGGATFSSETADQPIGTEMRAAGDAYIVIDPSGNIHVTWQGAIITSPIVYEAFYSRSTDGGVTWSGLSGPQNVDFGIEDETSIHNHAMAVTCAGDLIVIWQETPLNYEDSEIWASYSTDGGTTWSGNLEPERLSFPDGYGGYNPDVIAGVGESLHVVWNEGVASSGYYDIHYSKGDTLVTDCAESIPTLSEWGMLLMTLILLALGSVALIRKSVLLAAPGKTP